MQSAAQLQELLRSINRKSYPAYKSTKGTYQFKNYILSIDHVQGDPFASPSHISVRIRHTDSRIPAEYYQDTLTKITLSDFLTRQFERQVSQYLPCKRLREKRPDPCYALWTGGTFPHCLSDYRSGDCGSVFHWLSGKRPHN